ncbi:MAG: transglycosylase domain-containing protein [Micavibrio sp.]|nr:transglycosylase domain-containing protein [Micavibrio sp.]
MATEKNNSTNNQPEDSKHPDIKDNKNIKHGPWYKTLPKWVYVVTASTVIIGGGAAIENKTSYVQSKIFGRAAAGKSFTETHQTSPTVAPPAAGPYDERLGYTQTLKFRERLQEHGYQLEQENSWQERKIAGVELFPIYNEKAQAGLRIADDNNKTLFASTYPRQAYADFDSIPPLLVNSLLFVENRDLMDEQAKTWNPAIEWKRFAGALMGFGLKKVGVHTEHAGGSTLATQIEKFRHSPEGITATGKEKLRQMLTASVRAYDADGTTVDSRRRIVSDYLNSMPLSSYPGFGEVNGFADGMQLWFGTRFEDANKLLMKPEAQMTDAEMRDAARVYRESLSLVMAVKKPSAYLLKDRGELEDRIDKFMPLLSDAGIISPKMRDMVLSERVNYATPVAASDTSIAPPIPKSAQGLRVELLKTLGVRGMYELNRLDVTARTTIDAEADAAVSKRLRSLADPDTATKAGLTGFQLLKPETAGDVIYSFALYEKTPEGNVLRVQTDNFNGPLNLNEGTKLELGSTAKLRTLVSYLEAVSDLHEKYKDADAETLRTHKTHPNDHITQWAMQYLAAPDTDKSLNAMLEAALNRTYSGSPGEAFFTGGGLHRFENFERKEDFQNYTVKDAFHHSVNLSFIRIMRDVVYYTEGEKMHVDTSIYDDPNSPMRQEYLKKFADAEGTSFMWKFWKQQKDKSPDELATLLAEKTRRTPVQLAVVYRSLFPDAPYEKFAEFVQKECPTCKPGDDFHKQYDNYAKDKFNLNDRGYLTRLHPLELWMASNRMATPDATWDQTVDASKDVRLETYKWLFVPTKMHAQNIRIQTMLEKEAFGFIHDTWAAKGYSFAAMVPSYASALGASGDTPYALAEFSGIIQNDGVYKKSIKFRDISFAENTPYSLQFKTKQDEGHRVLPAELTTLVRREMQGVVEDGTAHRAFNAVKLSNGQILPVGGKTGTGDNRLQTFTAGGALKSSDAKSRTATFVYAIDDKFYGCVTAYVMGSTAGQYKFTSALAAQVFKTVIPDVQPILDRAYGVTPDSPKVDVPKPGAKTAAPESVENKTKPAVAAKPPKAA